MATEQSRNTRTFIAGEDLSTAQFKFVTLGTGGEVSLPSTAGVNCIGVLRTDGAAGVAVAVLVDGPVKVECGGTVTNGAAVATDDTGRAVDATTGDIIMGYAMEAGVVNQMIQIELIQGGNAAA